MMGLIDQSVIAAYLSLILAISVWIARKQRTGDDYFLAGRSLSGAALAMSIIANQVSAVSLIGAPAFVALRGGMKWLQYELAVPLAMLLLIAYLLPALRAVSGASIYEVIERRFGWGTRRLLAATSCHRGICRRSSGQSDACVVPAERVVAVVEPGRVLRDDSCGAGCFARPVRTARMVCDRRSNSITRGNVSTHPDGARCCLLARKFSSGPPAARLLAVVRIFHAEGFLQPWFFIYDHTKMHA
jgi:hypothetical protein